MEGKVLVAYGTKYGATQGIAERIGSVLTEDGLTVDVLPADNVGELTPYGAVVAGSGVYIGRWRKEAARFLKTREKELKQKRVWLFSSGPTGEGDPETLLKGWTFPESLKPLAEAIGPVDIAVFGGTIEKEKLKGLEKWMLKKVEAGIGDFRNWEAITAWARSIAKKLNG